MPRQPARDQLDRRHEHAGANEPRIRAGGIRGDSRVAEPSKSTGAAAWLAPLAILATVLLAYSTSLDGQFIFDDQPAILENPHVRSLWPIWNALGAPSDTAPAGRPLVCLTLAIDYAISGYHVWSYHVTNGLIHLAAALALYGLLRRTLKLSYWTASATVPARAETRDGSAARASTERAPPAEAFALAVTLLWCAHPLHTESITYISSRTEALAGLFVLLTISAAIQAATAPPAVATRWTLTAIASGALGVASKESAILVGLVFWLYDRTFLAGSFLGALRRRALLYVGLAANGILLALLLATKPRSLSVTFDYALIPWHDYLFTQFGVIVYYLRMALWPYPLLIDYDGWPIARSLLPVLPQFLLLAALGVGTLAALARRHWLGVVGAFFFIMLGPSSSFVPLITEIGADRRMYLPLISVAIALCAIGRALLARASWSSAAARRWAGAAVVLLPTLALAATTAVRNRDFAQPEKLWRELIERLPGTQRGRIALALLKLDQGRLQEGEQLLRAALELESRHTVALQNLGVALGKQARWADAAQTYQRLVELLPQNARARADLGLCLTQAGRPAEAVVALEAAQQLDARLPGLDARLAQAYSAAGQPQKAVQSYAAALAAEPGNAALRRGFALLLAGGGFMAEALQQLDAAEQAAPRDSGVLHARGIVLELAGRVAEAAAAFRRALAAQPDDAGSAEKLAWILATAADSALRDPPEALRLAELSLAKANPRTPLTYDTLAAAYAANARFADAVRTAEEGERAARELGAEKLARDIEQRLARYRAGKPAE